MMAVMVVRGKRTWTLSYRGEDNRLIQVEFSGEVEKDEIDEVIAAYCQRQGLGEVRVEQANG